MIPSSVGIMSSSRRTMYASIRSRAYRWQAAAEIGARPGKAMRRRAGWRSGEDTAVPYLIGLAAIEPRFFSGIDPPAVETCPIGRVRRSRRAPELVPIGDAKYPQMPAGNDIVTP